jgi:hypothetical protein
VTLVWRGAAGIDGLTMNCGRWLTVVVLVGDIFPRLLADEERKGRGRREERGWVVAVVQGIIIEEIREGSRLTRSAWRWGGRTTACLSLSRTVA